MPRRNNAAGRRAKAEGAASQATTLDELVEPGPDQAADETGIVELENSRSAPAVKQVQQSDAVFDSTAMASSAAEAGADAGNQDAAAEAATGETADRQMEFVTNRLPGIEKATELKGQANELVRQHKSSEAEVVYRAALAELAECEGERMLQADLKQIFELKAVLHGNIAQCMLNLNLYRRAIDAATDSLCLKEQNVKVLHRRSLAHEALKEWDKALEDALQVKKLGGGSLGATAALTRCELLYEKVLELNKTLKPASEKHAEDLKMQDMKKNNDAAVDKYILEEEECTDAGSLAGARRRKHKKHKKRSAARVPDDEVPHEDKQQVASSHLDIAAPPHEAVECGEEIDVEEEFFDSEWQRLRDTVAQRAEEHLSTQPTTCPHAALLKALWSVEAQFSPGDVARYMDFILSSMDNQLEEPSEAQWWFGEAPENLEDLGCL